MQSFAKQGESKRTRIDILLNRRMMVLQSYCGKVTKESPILSLFVGAYSVFKTAPVRENLIPNLVFRYVGVLIKKHGMLARFWRNKNFIGVPQYFLEGAH